MYGGVVVQASKYVSYYNRHVKKFRCMVIYKTIPFNSLPAAFSHIHQVVTLVSLHYLWDTLQSVQKDKSKGMKKQE